jgi:hypothetical protein
MAFSLYREYFEVSFFISSGCGGMSYYSKMCRSPNSYNSRPSFGCYSANCSGLHSSLRSLWSRELPCE